MKKQKMHIYYDAEADYLEIRFGKPTPSTYKKIGLDTFARIDNNTGEVKGYAIYNVKKGSYLKSLDVEIPLTILDES